MVLPPPAIGALKVSQPGGDKAPRSRESAVREVIPPDRDSLMTTKQFVGETTGSGTGDSNFTSTEARYTEPGVVEIGCSMKKICRSPGLGVVGTVRTSALLPSGPAVAPLL